VMPGYRGHQEVRRRGGNARGTAPPSKIDSQVPNLSCSLNLLEISFQAPQDFLLLRSASSIPKLQQYEVAEDSLAGGHQGRNLCPDLRYAIAPKGMHPRRGVDQNSLGHPSPRSRSTSSGEGKPSNVPSWEASTSKRRRRLNSTRAATTASFLVRAPVEIMASSNSLSGIFTVVFIASILPEIGNPFNAASNVPLKGLGLPLRSPHAFSPLWTPRLDLPARSVRSRAPRVAGTQDLGSRTTSLRSAARGRADRATAPSGTGRSDPRGGGGRGDRARGRGADRRVS